MGRSFTIQMFWNCPSCGQKRNPGMTGMERDSLRCVNCGYEKQESDEWIMPDSPELQPHLEGEPDRKARAGKNWTCKFCHKESRQDHDDCEICGAPRRAPEKQPEKVLTEPLTNKEVFEKVAKRELTPKQGAEAMLAYDKQFDPREKVLDTARRTALPILGGALGVGLLIWLVVWLVTPRETDVHVRDMHWTRSEVLQERHDYAGEGWQDREPGGVFEETCSPRQRGTHDCNPHDCRCHPETYDCRCTGGDSYSCRCHESCRTSCSSNRNGSATCSESCSTSCDTCYTPRRCDTCSRTVCDTCYDQCPTIVNWCNYRYHQWDTLDQHALDRHDNQPVWPSPPFVAQHSLQRVDREESYNVQFVDDEDVTRRWDRGYTAEQFVMFQMNQRWHVRYTHAGSFELVRRMP